ncbi:MAG: GNVR domain-containing protein [Bacillota bacterium]|nr:GNVR domain-containing protein [Bacillota bacterium]
MNELQGPEPALRRELPNYRQIFWQQRWVIILTLLCALGASLAATLLTKPVYRSESVLLARQTREAENYATLGIGGLGRYRVENFTQILKSRSLLQEAAQSAGLPGALSAEAKELARLQRAVTAYFIPGTDLLRVQVEWDNPRTARDLNQALVEGLLNHSRRFNKEALLSAQRFVEERVALAEKELLAAEEALLNARKSSTEPSQDVLRIGTLPHLVVLVAKTQVALDAARTALGQAQLNFRRAGGRPEVISGLLNQPPVRETRIELGELERQYAIQLERLGEEEAQKQKEPLARLLATREVLYNSLLRLAPRPSRAGSEYRRALEALARRQVEELSLRARLYALNTLIAQRQEAYSPLSSRQAEVVALERKARIAEQMYALLRQKLEELRLAEAADFADIQVVDEPSLPSAPIRPNLPVNLALAGVVGLLTGLGLAVFISSQQELDQSLSTFPRSHPALAEAAATATAEGTGERAEKAGATPAEATPAPDYYSYYPSAGDLAARTALWSTARRSETPLWFSALTVALVGIVIGLLASFLLDYLNLTFSKDFYIRLKEAIKILLGQS